MSTSASMRARMAVINVKRASVLDLKSYLRLRPVRLEPNRVQPNFRFWLMLGSVSLVWADLCLVFYNF